MVTPLPFKLTLILIALVALLAVIAWVACGPSSAPLPVTAPYAMQTPSSSAPLSTTAPYAMQTPSSDQLENREVGYSLIYPDGWQIKGQVVATEFAMGAECQSLEIIDFQPPPGSGAPGVLHSFVQICAKRVKGGSTLDEFMRQEYGDAFLDQFEATELGGAFAYETKGEGQDTMIFLQTSDYRLQIVRAVVAKSDVQSERLSQVQEILESFTLTKREEDQR